MGSVGDRFNIVPSQLQKTWRRCRRGRLAAVIAAALLAGCTISEDQRGNLPDPEKLARVQPGSTTKEQVAKILGSPSSESTFNDDTWYYISRRTKQVAFLNASVLDQQVYIVDFDDRGVVKDVGHRTMADGESITPAPGATPSPGRELTFIEQLLGNIGRFNSGSATPSGQ
jgi:outer membrane protein assembly factor BamE (lipoprotein component of BamABCDE complex)